jgi:hypothetical protein
MVRLLEPALVERLERLQQLRHLMSADLAVQGRLGRGRAYGKPNNARALA